MIEIKWPHFANNRGSLFWLKPTNIFRSRRKFLRFDRSTEWRRRFAPLPEHGEARSAPFSALLGRNADTDFRFVLIGDTGEGDRSQYALLPLLRAVAPDFMIIVGDVAYPAGNFAGNPNDDDYVCGLFRPYAALKCPIWAVPGNHEYYSARNGREFYELFCTNKHAPRWGEYGLPFVPQPGTYWELKEPSSRLPLTVIGVDTGMSGSLDGGHFHKLFGAFHIDVGPDRRQHSWLESRLAAADEENRLVIVLFHIPALVGGRSDRHVRLKELHRIIAQHRCVRLVMAGHEHNFQYYSPEVFSRYLKASTGLSPERPPHYLINGGGGAHLTPPGESKDYPSQFVFPTADQVFQRSTPLRKLGLMALRLFRQGKSASAAALADRDNPKFLSFVLVEVRQIGDRREITLAPYLMDDLQTLLKRDGHTGQVDPLQVVLSAETAASCRRGPVINLAAD